MTAALLLALALPVSAAVDAAWIRTERAITNGDLAAVQAMVAEGFDPLSPFNDRRAGIEGTWLWMAADRGEEAVFNRLLAACESRLRKRDFDALLRANAVSPHGTNRQILDTLAAKGAETRFEFVDLPAVAYAARMGNVVAARFFIDKGHDVNARVFAGGPTALSSSIGCVNDYDRCEEVFRLLREKGARPTLWAFEQARRTLARRVHPSVSAQWRDSTLRMTEDMKAAAAVESKRCQADAGMVQLAYEFLRLRKEEPDDIPKQYAVRGRVEDAGCVSLFSEDVY